MSISLEELQLAARNHGMPLEALRHEITPLGLHYLLTHYDIPAVDPASWRLTVGGRVAYAVLSFGGFMGIGDDYYPLPWEKLTYDEELDGYRIDMTKDQITGAPRYRDLEDDSWYNDKGRTIYDYYGVPPYWM